MVPGDVVHLLTAQCPALQPLLATTLLHLNDMLSPYPQLLALLLDVLNRENEACTSFLLDPSTDARVISLCQVQGQAMVLIPLFRACRAWVWAVHRARMKFLGLERYLL